MRYNQIRECDIANGEGIGVALFVQGCHFRCKNCFNPETWDFNGGKEWTLEVKEKFLELASRPYIKRISLLGGECLTDENLDDVLDLVRDIRKLFPNKSIWLYSGFDFETSCFLRNTEEEYTQWHKREKIISYCDVMVDGVYIDELRDISLRWCGSKNQRIIDIKKSLERGEIVLWTS